MTEKQLPIGVVFKPAVYTVQVKILGVRYTATKTLLKDAKLFVSNIKKTVLSKAELQKDKLRYEYGILTATKRGVASMKFELSNGTIKTITFRYKDIFDTNNIVYSLTQRWIGMSWTGKMVTHGGTYGQGITYVPEHYKVIRLGGTYEVVSSLVKALAIHRSNVGARAAIVLLGAKNITSVKGRGKDLPVGICDIVGIAGRNPRLYTVIQINGQVMFTKSKSYKDPCSRKEALAIILKSRETFMANNVIPKRVINRKSNQGKRHD